MMRFILAPMLNGQSAWIPLRRRSAQKRMPLMLKQLSEIFRLGSRAASILLMLAPAAAFGQVQSPQPTDTNRIVGPQKDGSIVVSDNQTLTPAGKIIELGSPVRAKSLALNPNSKTTSAAVLLMASPQPIIVFN